MNRDENFTLVRDIMQDFAGTTGLDPVSLHPRRYLWTDAFALCNYLGLYQKSHDEMYGKLALRLVDQVHFVLGRHRDDDPRAGWISGLSDDEGKVHPTTGGLRIGKTLPERKRNEPFSEQLEWEQDGQYYHYLTKWMHALNQVSLVTGNPDYNTWAVELARTAHAGFTYNVPGGNRKRMYWKMSIDLSRPLVPSMGQHDPPDGLVTYTELQMTGRNFGQTAQPVLVPEIAEMTAICRSMHLATDDPLGTGGLLSDAARIAGLMNHQGPEFTGLLETLIGSALAGLDSFTRSGSLERPADYRLAFRELGLSIGLSGVEKLEEWIGKIPGLPDRKSGLHHQVQALRSYVPLERKDRTILA